MTFSPFARAPKMAALSLCAALALSSVSSQALACACGCGVFDIGGFNYAPNNSDTGLSIWGRYDYMVQNRNMEGSSFAPAWDNADKKIATSFYTLGGQYMINNDWGVMAMAPFYQRAFTTTYTDPANNSYVGTFNMFAPGDLKLMGSYSGFSPDHSWGLLFGVKLPTGQWKSPTYAINGNVYSYAAGNGIYDRDSTPGTGSTDLIFGGYTQGALSADQKWVYFARALYQFSVISVEGYRPGNEFDVALGTTYDLGAFGSFTKVAPVVQAITSLRMRDSGWASMPLNSGYERVLLAPGLDLRVGKFKLYADVEVPVYQHVRAIYDPVGMTEGQLVASVLYKVQIGYDF